MEGKDSDISEWFDYGDVQKMYGGAAKKTAAKKTSATKTPAKTPCTTFKNKAGQCKPWATCAKYQDLVRSTNTCKNKVCSGKFLNKTTGNCEVYKTCTAPDTLVKTTNTCKKGTETKETCAKKAGYHWNNTKKSCEKGACPTGQVLDVNGTDPKKCVNKGQESCKTNQVKVKGICEAKMDASKCDANNGQVYNKTSNKCDIKCPATSGQKWDGKKCVCKIQGETYDRTTKKCKKGTETKETCAKKAGYHWNNTKKSCEKGACPTGQVLDVNGTDPKKCVNKGQESCKTNQVKVKGICEAKMDASKCDANNGQVYNKTSNKCDIKCPATSGQKWDGTRCVCKIQGETYDRTTKKCKMVETKETCAKKAGYRWDPVKKSCEKGACPTGQVLDVNGTDPKKCVNKGKEACKTNEVKVKGICEAKTTCAEYRTSNNKCAAWTNCTKKVGTQLDKKTNTCKKLTQAECKTPNFWNTTRKICESSVSCSDKTPFKTKSNKCVAYVKCNKTGTHLDEKTNTCKQDTKADCDTKKDHHWDATKNVCLKGAPAVQETEESCAKKTGYHWNPKTKKCDKNTLTCTKPQIKINNECQDPKKCAAGESLDTKTNTCKACDGFMDKQGRCVPFLKCASGKVLDKTTNTCSVACPAGQVRPTKGRNKGKCVAKATCKDDQDYDATTNECKAKACPAGQVRPTKGTDKGKCVAKATCKDTETYDVATNTCKAKACATGEVKPTEGPNKDKCVKKATCKAPRKVWNKKTNECECPNGQTYDDINKKCSVCKAGETSVNGKCVPKTECKENEILDKKTNTCICKAGFVKPAEGSNAGKCVARATCKKPKTNLNKKTNECECPKGQLYSEKGNKCFKCNAGEVINQTTGKCEKDTGASGSKQSNLLSGTSVPIDPVATLGTLTQSGLVSINPSTGLPQYPAVNNYTPGGPGAFPGVNNPTDVQDTPTSLEFTSKFEDFKEGFAE